MKRWFFCFLFHFICVSALAAGQGDLSFSQRPKTDQVIFDFADVLQDFQEERLSQVADRLYAQADIEFLVVLAPSLQGTNINSWTNQLFNNWAVGRRTKGNRGLLFVIDLASQQVRLEVGHDLEGIYPDAFVAYIEREQMKPFFEEGRLGIGLEATLELIATQAWKSIDSGDYLVNQSQGLGGTAFRSSGGGARTKVDIASRQTQQKEIVPTDVKKYFSAQSSPQETLARYFEASQKHIKDPDLGIFTDETKEFFRNWTVTNAQQDSERQYANVPFEIRTDGDYAVIFYPESGWTFSPFFLKRSQEGWQLDFSTMSRVIRFNQRNYWHFVSRDHPFMFAFSDYSIDNNGFVWFKRRKQERGFINILFPYGDVPIPVRQVVKGSSAEQAGLKPGDVITHINGKDVRKIGFQGFLHEAVGNIGTTLELEVKRPSVGKTLHFTIERTEEKF